MVSIAAGLWAMYDGIEEEDEVCGVLKNASQS